MKTPSRSMPPPILPRKPGVWGWLFLGALVAPAAWKVMKSGAEVWILVAAGALGLLASIWAQRRWLARMREARRTESICTFARALPARAHDTWVVRAVFEEVMRKAGVPVRPTDTLEGDLRSHPDDLDDVALEIARRAGRSMAETKGNPMFDRVKTVADMVAFFEYQPRIAEGPGERDLTRGSIG